MTINIEVTPSEETAIEAFLETQVVVEPDPETRLPTSRRIYSDPEAFVRAAVAQAVRFAQSRA